MLIRFTAIVLILLLSWSCEEVVELDVDFDPAVVAVSELAPGQQVRVTLNRARPVLSQDPTEYIVASEVTITNRRTGQITELFLEDPTKDSLNTEPFPYYASGEAIVGSGNNYELNVKIDGEEPLSAITTIPDQVEIQSLNMLVFSENSDPRDDDRYDIHFELNFNHNSRKAQSYHLVYYFIYSVLEETESDTFVVNYIQSPTVNDFSMDFPYTFDFENGVLIQGKDIPEGNHRLEANLSVEYNDARSPFVPRLFVELRNTNFDYHDYHFKLSRQLSQRDSILSQAILVPSNINNGLGVFSGYNYDFESIELEE